VPGAPHLRFMQMWESTYFNLIYLPRFLSVVKVAQLGGLCRAKPEPRASALGRHSREARPALPKAQLLYAADRLQHRNSRLSPLHLRPSSARSRLPLAHRFSGGTRSPREARSALPKAPSPHVKGNVNEATVFTERGFGLRFFLGTANRYLGPRRRFARVLRSTAVPAPGCR
jgi:hypothetical protein